MQKQAPLTPAGAASYLKSTLEVCKMFSDLGDQQHVFSLLDEWANSDNGLDLTYLTGSESTIGKEITRLLLDIHDEELETIKNNPDLKIGFSEQSQLLKKLLNLLAIAHCPSFLSINLSEIKKLLLQANSMGLVIKADKLKVLAAVGLAVKEGGRRAHEDTYGTDQDKTEKRNKWQAWVNETIKNHPDHSFEAVKKIVVKSHSGEVSMAQLKRYTKDTRKT